MSKYNNINIFGYCLTSAARTKIFQVAISQNKRKENK